MHMPNCMISDFHGWCRSPPRYPQEQDAASTSSVCPRSWLQDACSSAERIAVLRRTHELAPPSDPSVLITGDPGAAAQLDVRGSCQQG